MFAKTIVATLCIVLAIAAGTCLAGQEISLTDLEKSYIEKEGVLSLCVDPDWIPFERINENGEHEGIAADLIKILSNRTGITFVLVPTKSWEESISYSQDGKCQALSFLNETSKRKEWLSFSDPLFTDVNVFITREEHPYISDPGGLVGEVLVLPKGTSIEEMLKSTYPNITIITVETEADALKMVSERKADMTLRSLIVAAYTIKKEGWFNLKISGQLPGYQNNLRIAVSKEKEHILDIVNRGISSITGQDRGTIVNKHVSINIQSVTDYSLLYKVTISFAGILMVVSAWVLQLRRHNRELARISQTDTLTGLANRTRLNAVLNAEYKRSMRHWRPLSILIVDVDHFKLVNDEFGHLVGDVVLKELGLTLLSSVRDVDIVGRWGGEEFLIICPETDADNASTVAGRIVSMVAAKSFSTNRAQTVSVGVASLTDNDTTDGLLSRADAALYCAKNSGRDRYCRAPCASGT